MSFKKYQHVERIGTELVDHILNDNHVIIQTKLDGANASIWFDSDSNIHCGSRNKELLSSEDGITGFYEYVHKNKNKFLGLCRELLYLSSFTEQDALEGINRITIYGEWLIPHSFKEYNDDSWEKFYIFDILKHNYVDSSKSYFLHYHTLPYYIKRYDLDCVPYMYMNGDDVKNILDNQRYNELEPITTFLTKDSSCGEGIVIKNYVNQRNKHNDFKWAKLVFPHFKQKHKETFGQPKEKLSLEEQVIEKYLTPELVEKEYQKLINNNGDSNTKLIPQMLETVFYVLITEEMYNIVKKYKLPTINFKLLKTKCTEKIKEVKGELF